MLPTWLRLPNAWHDVCLPGTGILPVHMGRRRPAAREIDIHIKVSTDCRFFFNMVAAAGRQVGGDGEHDGKRQDSSYLQNARVL